MGPSPTLKITPDPLRERPEPSTRRTPMPPPRVCLPVYSHLIYPVTRSGSRFVRPGSTNIEKQIVNTVEFGARFWKDPRQVRASHLISLVSQWTHPWLSPPQVCPGGGDLLFPNLPQVTGGQGGVGEHAWSWPLALNTSWQIGWYFQNEHKQKCQEELEETKMTWKLLGF